MSCCLASTSRLVFLLSFLSCPYPSTNTNLNPNPSSGIETQLYPALNFALTQWYSYQTSTPVHTPALHQQSGELNPHQLPGLSTVSDHSAQMAYPSSGHTLVSMAMSMAKKIVSKASISSEPPRRPTYDGREKANYDCEDAYYDVHFIVRGETSSEEGERILSKI